jgi:hypothetical protein
MIMILKANWHPETRKVIGPLKIKKPQHYLCWGFLFIGIECKFYLQNLSANR